MRNIILLVLFFSICTVSAQNKLSFTNFTIKDQSQSPKYSITVNYPQITGKDLGASEKQFNNIIKERMNKSIENFKQTVNENEKYPVPSEIKAHGSTLSSDYQIAMINKSFISLRYGMDIYFAGAAHPTHTYQSLNFDLSQNKELTLSNLFQAKTNYLQKIADYATKQLKTKLKNDAFQEGFNPIVKNYQVWNTLPKGLRITFNEYQVAPYVYGPQQVIIPYSYLKNILSEKTAIGKCLKTQQCQIKILELAEKG